MPVLLKIIGFGVLWLAGGLGVAWLFGCAARLGGPGHRLPANHEPELNDARLESGARSLTR